MARDGRRYMAPNVSGKVAMQPGRLLAQLLTTDAAAARLTLPELASNMSGFIHALGLCVHEQKLCL